MNKEEWEKYRAEFELLGFDIITYDHMVALSENRKITILDEYRGDSNARRLFDDTDTSWAEEPRGNTEAPPGVRVPALEKARVHWSYKAKRIARANSKKQTREDRRR